MSFGPRAKKVGQACSNVCLGEYECFCMCTHTHVCMYIFRNLGWLLWSTSNGSTVSGSWRSNWVYLHTGKQLGIVYKCNILYSCEEDGYSH